MGVTMAGLAELPELKGWVSVSAPPWTRGDGCSEEALGVVEPQVTRQEDQEEEEEEAGQEPGMLGLVAVVGEQEPPSCRIAASLIRRYPRKISGRGQSYPPPSQSDASSCQHQPRLLLEERRESWTLAAPQHPAGAVQEQEEVEEEEENVEILAEEWLW